MDFLLKLPGYLEEKKIRIAANSKENLKSSYSVVSGTFLKEHFGVIKV